MPFQAKSNTLLKEEQFLLKIRTIQILIFAKLDKTYNFEQSQRCSSFTTVPSGFEHNLQGVVSLIISIIENIGNRCTSLSCCDSCKKYC